MGVGSYINSKTLESHHNPSPSTCLTTIPLRSLHASGHHPPLQQPPPPPLTTSGRRRRLPVPGTPISPPASTTRILASSLSPGPATSSADPSTSSSTPPPPLTSLLFLFPTLFRSLPQLFTSISSPLSSGRSMGPRSSKSPVLPEVGIFVYFGISHELNLDPGRNPSTDSTSLWSPTAR